MTNTVLPVILTLAPQKGHLQRKLYKKKKQAQQLTSSNESNVSALPTAFPTSASKHKAHFQMVFQQKTRIRDPVRKGEHLNSLFKHCRYTANNVYKKPEAWIPGNQRHRSQRDEILNKINGSALEE